MSYKTYSYSDCTVFSDSTMSLYNGTDYHYSLNWRTDDIAEEWRNGNFCDVTLIAKEDGTRIKAHRLILSVSSEYFKTMFFSAFKEGTANEIEISDISGNELMAFIKYSYTGKIEINKNNAQKLLSKASFMMYEDVVKLCENYLINQVEASNYFELTFFAKLYNCKCLLDAIKYYQRNHFEDLFLVGEEVLNLSAEEIYQCLSERETLDADLENNVFKCVMRWIKYDYEGRKKFLPKLFSTIHLRLIESNNLLDDITNEVRDNEECTQIIKKVIEDAAALKDKNLLIGLDRRMFIYNFKMNAKQKFKKILLDPDTFFDAACIGTKLIVVDTEVKPITVINLNIKTYVFTNFPKTLNSILDCKLAVINDDLYVIGKTECKNQYNCVIERFDFIKNKWNLVTNLQESIFLNSCALKEKIYVIFKDYEDTIKMQCFDIKTNSWRALCAPLLEEQSYLSMIASKNELFVFNYCIEYSEIESIKKYDPETDKWTVLSLTNSYETLTACLVANKFIVIGAGNQWVMEEIDPKTNKCQVIANIPTGRDTRRFSICIEYKEKFNFPKKNNVA